MVKPLLYSVFPGFFYSFVPDFGELSKKLAEVWKQLPEKDKLVSRLYHRHIFHCSVLPKCVILLCCCCCSVVQLCLTLASPRTVAHQALLSMGFPREGYWSGLPFPSPGDVSHPGIAPSSPALAGGFFTPEHMEARYTIPRAQISLLPHSLA